MHFNFENVINEALQIMNDDVNDGALRMRPIKLERLTEN